MECFAEILNTYYRLTNFAKRSILDVWQTYEYAFAQNPRKFDKLKFVLLTFKL